MRFEIEGRTIKQHGTKLGTQGENNIEEIEFTIQKIVGNADLSQAGTQCMLYCITADKQEIEKMLDFAELDETTMMIKWSIGRDETQSVGILYVAIHFTTAFDNVLKTEISMFEVKRTINIESQQPVLFSSRRANFAVHPETEFISVSNNKFVIPAVFQNVAVQNDNDAKVIPIKMPRTYAGEDLSTYPIKLHVETQGGSEWIIFEPKVFNDEITLLWTVRRPHTSYAGSIRIQLEVGEENTDTFFKQTEIGVLNVLPSLGNEPIVPVSPPEFAKYLKQIEEIKAQAVTAKDQSVAAKDVSTAKAKESADSAALSAEQVKKAKAEVVNAQSEVVKATEQAVIATEKAVESSGSAQAAGASKTGAEVSASYATEQADRAKAEADRAASITGNLGFFPTPQTLQAAHPVGKNGQFAIVGTTDTVWTWDGDLSVWFNTQSSGVESNYEALDNKPSLNSVLLVGNKSLADIGAQAKGDYPTKQEVATSISTHNTSKTAHLDIRKEIADITAESVPIAPIAGLEASTVQGALEGINGLSQNKDIYVSPAGNDTSGDGSEARPYKTIQKAVNSAPKNITFVS